MKKALLTGVVALLLTTGTAYAEADTCGPLPDVCNVTAMAAPSGNPEWPIRLTVENNSDRKLAAIKWVCRGRPWEVADPTNPGVMLESRDVEAHSTKSWDFRIAGLEPSFPYCKTGLFEWWK